MNAFKARILDLGYDPFLRHGVAERILHYVTSSWQVFFCKRTVPVCVSYPGSPSFLIVLEMVRA